MLDDDLKTQLSAYLEKLTRPVQLVAALDEGETSREMQGFLEDIVVLSDKITLVSARGDDARVPSFSITRPGEDLGIRFAGIPSGHEFTSLVLALLHVGGHPPKAGAELIEQIAGLEGEHLFETYISLSCQNCPDVVQALNLMALLNSNIRHVTIDGALFQDEIAAREIMSVPTVFRNGQPFEQGRMTIEQIIGRLDTRAAKRDADRLDARTPFDVLVVGGGPAGAAAAIYAARKGIRTGIVAERMGGQLLDTMGVENFISVQHTEGPKLAAQLEQHVLQYDVDLMQPHRAESLVQDGEHTIVHLANGASLRARSVVLSTGARWKQINVPGEAEYRNRGVAYCPHCDGPLFKGKRVAVVGGGNSGVEAAIDLAGLVRHVTLVEFDAQLRADEVLQRKLRSLGNVTVVTCGQTTEVLGDGQRVTGLVYKDRVGGDTHRVELEGVFVQIGLLPNTEWLKGSLKLSDRGEIEVDDHGATSLPGVFAAGDATTTPYKQIVVAMGDGSKAALSAFDYLIRVPVISPVDRLQTEAA